MLLLTLSAILLIDVLRRQYASHPRSEIHILLIGTAKQPISIMRYILRDRHDAIKCIASYLRNTRLYAPPY
jgi:hypothetical protein